MAKVAELDWKEFATYTVFSFFGGCLGLDRLYKGQRFWGTLKLITIGGAALWWIADAAWYACCLGKTGQWRN